MRPQTARALVIAACIPAGFGFVTALGIGNAEPPHGHGTLEVGDLAGVPGSDSIEAVTRDPKGKGRDWGVVVFKSKSGNTCAAPGRKQGNKVGEVAPDGSFHEYPIEDGATCADLRKVPAVLQVTSGLGRTTIHGVAGPKVRTITVTANGSSRDLDLSPRGGFLAVLPEEVRPSPPVGDNPPGLPDVKVSATLKDGTVMPLLGG